MGAKPWKAPFVRAPGNYDPDEASQQAAVTPEGESMTQQHQAEDADINVIVRRFGLTGGMPANPVLPRFIDYDDVFDFRSALEAVTLAEDAFMQFPAELRARFENDPQKFLQFVDERDEKGARKNAADLVKFGLMPAPEPPAPEKIQKVEVVNPPKPDSSPAK